MTDIIFKVESYSIIGVLLKVYKKLGSVFLESVCSEVLEVEFKSTGIPYEKVKKLPAFYDD